jgi:hypothetical protein
MRSLLFLLAIILFSTEDTFAQDLSKYEWKNRLLLILVQDEKQADYTEQLKLLGADSMGLQERKLLIISVTPEQYKTGLDGKSWKKAPSLYIDFKGAKGNFEVILIGLDGGVKLRKETVLTLEELYSTIDVMPMRRYEIEKKN